MWLLLNQSVVPGHWLLGAVLGIVAPLLAPPLQPHGHARPGRPLALLRLLWLSAIEIVRSCLEIVPDSHELLLHVFDLHDEQWWVETIKTRYEQPIIEVFEAPDRKLRGDRP